MPNTSPLAQRPRVSVVIPARNEARNIPIVLAALPADCVDEVILVDGGSTDGTIGAALAARQDILVVLQTRKGKGNALAAGFEAATGEYIVMIDADGSMDPEEIRDFVAALDAGADYAKGSRFARGGGSADITVVRRLGNMFLNGTTNLLFRTRFSDLCYGYNAFRRECVAAFALPPAHDDSVEAYWGDGFEIETLINVRVAKAGMRIASFEAERIFGESNLRTFRDGFRVLATILRERRSGAGSGAAVSPMPAASPDRVMDLTVHERQSAA
jgi:glycosyltransferase involved in cell wall biosynthesis